MVYSFIIEHDRIYRGIPVRADHLSEYGCIPAYDCDYSTVDEQPPELFSLTFLNDFKRMGKRKLYMIHSLTDETYAVNCTLELPRKEKEDTMFGVALLSHCYWMAATVAGAVLGQLIPFELEGIDFCMTALFVIIFMDQWKKASSHIPALAGLTCGIVCLLIFGQSSFILPALLLVSGILFFAGRKEAAE